MITADPPARLSPWIALLSIAGFWLFYFILLSIRAMAIYGDHIGLGNRAIVSSASAGLTVLVYLLMRRVPAARLRRSIVVAALLAMPASILYSSLNWYVFDLPQYHGPIDWSWSHHHARMSPVPFMPPQNSMMHIPMPPPAPAAPAAPQTMSVGKDWDMDEMSPLQSIVDQAVNGYFFFASWAALYLALCYAAEVGALERRTAELRAAAQSAELRALRYQVNPHFLFNTLNSLSSLVLSGRKEAAERMIINLATFFRTSLTGDPTEDVPLAEEMRLQRLYLDIESVRFPDRLIVEFDVPAELATCCIPGLILQPLVENAVKYGVSRVTRPVTIRIRAREDAGELGITVEDDGDTFESSPEGGTGVGLRNVRDRIDARFGEDGHCRWGPRAGGGFAVHLILPIVRGAC